MFKKMMTIKKNKTNIPEVRGKIRVASYRSNVKIIGTTEPIPLDLLEKPDDARAKQWENTGMPSDFWL
jgi:hypothetical protein